MSLDPLGTSTAHFERRALDAIGLDPKARETLETLPLNQDALVAAIDETRAEINNIEAEPYVTWDTASALLTGARLIVDGDNVTFSTTATEISADLTDTGVVAGAYGDASHVIAITVDAKGRIVSAQAFPLESGHVTETTKLFYTDARARAALSSGSHISYNNVSGAIAFSGTGLSGTFASPTSITVADGLVTSIT